MFGRFTFFVAGVYTGVMTIQQYNIPKLPTPSVLVDKLHRRLEEYEKSGLKDKTTDLLKEFDKEYRRKS